MASDFEKEVEKAFRRAISEVPWVQQDHVILEVNALRLAYNMSFSDCVGAIFHSNLNLALEAPHATRVELLANAKNVLTKWRDLLKHYLKCEDDEVEVLLKFEEICVELGKEFAPICSKILEAFYDKDIVLENVIIPWAINDDYELGEEVRIRSDGIVWTSTPKNKGDVLCCKSLQKAYNQERITNKVEIMCRLPGHPGVVKLHDVYEESMCVHLTMKLGNGVSLLDAVEAKGTYSKNKVAQITKDIIEAIGYFHSKGVMHRDIKQEIMFDETNKVQGSPEEPIPSASLRITKLEGIPLARRNRGIGKTLGEDPRPRLLGLSH
eukprot:Gb_10762 [translate_table: standard]